jgi:HEAT repeat protein
MAAKSLGRLHDPGTIPALDRALADRAWSVRYNAAHALDELGGEGAAALRRALATQDVAFARDISRQMLEERHLAVAAESP